VVLYATGAGQTDPPGSDGKLAAEPWPKPRVPIYASIGGFPAEILYAGSAPVLVEGVLQVNVRVPADAPASDIVPVTLSVGNATSQPGVTMALR
jgi:trimeric autotransporter adhesin